MADVFVSYSRHDRPFVTRLTQALAERDRQVWVDTEDIPPTAEWFAEIQTAIAGSDAMLVVLSPQSLTSTVCRQETDYAQELSKRLIPVLRVPVDATQVPPYIAKHNWIDATDDALFDDAVDDIVTALDTDLDWARMHTRVLVRAQEWEAAGRDSSYVLRGSELADAESWVATQPPGGLQQATALQAEYIRASREAARRRQRRLSTALAAGLLLTSLLAVFAWTQRNTAVEQRQVARSRELSATARGSLSSDPELSILLAREALAFAPGDPAAEQALREALRDSHVRAEGRHDQAATWVEASPDGRWIATASADGTAGLWDPASGQRLATLAHDGPVGRVRFAVETSDVITASDDGTARVWDPGTGEQRATLAADGRVLDAALSPDGARAVTVTDTGAAVLWDVAAATSQRLEHEGGDLRSVSFSADGQWLVTAGGAAGGGGSAVVWDLEGRRVAGPLEQSEIIEDAAFSPDGNLLATAARDNLAMVFELPSGKRLSTLRGHDAEVVDVEFDSFSEWVVTASYDGTARLWRAADGAELHDYRGHATFVVSARFSADDRFVVTGSDDGTARIWDVEREDAVATLRGHQDVVRATFVPGVQPTGDRVATAGADGRVRLYDGAMGDLVAQYEGHLTDDFDAVLSVDFSPDGSNVVSAATDGTARVWEAATGEDIAPALSHEDSVETAVFDAQGERLVTASWDGTAATWDAEGALLTSFPDHDKRVQTAAFAPDGSAVVSAGNDGYARIWDAASGQQRHALGPRGRRMWNAVFSPDGTVVATGADDGTAALWDPTSGAVRHELTGQEGNIFGLAFTPDSAALATWGYVTPPGADVLGRVAVWDPTSGQQLAELVHPLAVEDAAFSNDGTVLATGSYDARTLLWNWATEDILLTLRGHTDAITGVAFSPDPASRWLATASYDGTARIWDTQTGVAVAVLRGHLAGIFDIAFSPDGSRLATAGEDGVAAVYACELCRDLDGLLELAESRALRDFTPGERELYRLDGATNHPN